MSCFVTAVWMAAINRLVCLLFFFGVVAIGVVHRRLSRDSRLILFLVVSCP